MIKDPVEIEIIKNAKQPNIADPIRSNLPFINIKKDFFKKFNFEDKKIMDLGPGHYDFFDILNVKEHKNLYAIDNDDAVLELGKYRNYSIQKVNLKTFNLQNTKTKIKFDLLFCKFSINAFWFYNKPEEHKKYIDYLSSLLNHNASSWIAPWNGLPKKICLVNDKYEIEKTLKDQINYFEQNGYQTLFPNERLVKRYGISGKVMNNPIFLKNL